MKWISVKDKLPTVDVDVLAIDNNEKDPTVYAAFYSGYWFTQIDSIQLDYVTHWMPMPNPPDGDEI